LGIRGGYINYKANRNELIELTTTLTPLNGHPRFLFGKGTKKRGSPRQKLKDCLLNLNTLIFAVQQGLLKNEGFSTWRNRGILNSRARTQFEKIREMDEKNLDRISWDPSEVEITAEVLNWDYHSLFTNYLLLASRGSNTGCPSPP